MNEKIRVLMITSEYPTAERPMGVPFIARQVDFLRRAGVEVDVFHFRGKKNPFNYIAEWWRLQRHTKGKKYDLMHAQWGHSATLALPKRLPWVITFRGNDLEGIIGENGKQTILGRVLKTVSKMMARMADGVIVVSESLADNIKRKDFQIIPSGLDLELFRPIPKAEARETLELPKEKKLILFATATIGNPRKRFALAQSAVDLLKNRFDVELIVATKVSHHLIPVYMNACDALLLTSIHEGSPNVVKESLACNLPVVSVDVGDVRRRIGEVEGCYVCPDDAPETIAEALKKVLNNGGRIKGRETMASLDEQITTQQVIEVYENVLSRCQAKDKNFITKSNSKKDTLEHLKDF